MFQMRQEEPPLPSATAQTGDGSKTEPLSVSIVPIEPERVVVLWPALQHHVRRALERGAGDRMSELELLRDLSSGLVRLLLAVRGGRGGDVIGVGLYQYTARTRGTCCQALAVSGVDHKLWLREMNDWLMAHAKVQRCYCVEAYCRDGVADILKSYGWRRKATVMEIKT